MSKRSIGRTGEWEWRPQPGDGIRVDNKKWSKAWKAHQKQQERMRKRAAKRLSKRLREARKLVPHPFYDDPRWRDLRYFVLRRDGARCVVCGRSAKDGVVIQVDHIKPRSTHPALQWDPNNLQVMCKDCNLGKSNRDTIDWR